MTPTFTDPRTGETVELRQDMPKRWRGDCSHSITVIERGRDIVALTRKSLIHVVLESGDIDDPADVQRALRALEGALAGRERAEENERLREALERVVHEHTYSCGSAQPLAVAAKVAMNALAGVTNCICHAPNEVCDGCRHALAKEALDVA